MNFYDINIAKKLSGGGGITPSGTLDISENGTFDVAAFAKALVAVPNSYSAGDEGKVVSNGALVAQSSQNIDANGTYDTTLKDEIVVNVSGGGGGLDYESGTLTTAEDSEEVSISFSKTHTTPPDIVLFVVDTSGSIVEQNTLSRIEYYYYKGLFGILYGRANTSINLTGIVTTYYRATGTTVASTATGLTAETSNPSDSSSGYPRYWVSESGFKAYAYGQSLIKAKYPYKWIAIWAPTS